MCFRVSFNSNVNYSYRKIFRRAIFGFFESYESSASPLQLCYLAQPFGSMNMNIRRLPNLINCVLCFTTTAVFWLNVLVL